MIIPRRLRFFIFCLFLSRWSRPLKILVWLYAYTCISAKAFVKIKVKRVPSKKKTPQQSKAYAGKQYSAHHPFSSIPTLQSKCFEPLPFSTPGSFIDSLILMLTLLLCSSWYHNFGQRSLTIPSIQKIGLTSLKLSPISPFLSSFLISTFTVCSYCIFICFSFWSFKWFFCSSKI